MSHTAVIDAHMHINFKGVRSNNIMAYLDKRHVEQCWLLTWEETDPIIPSKYMHLPVQDVFEAYQKYPSRIIPMYAPDPRVPDFEAKMMSWHQNGIKGCGELKVPVSWSSVMIERLLACVSDLRIPLVFHMQESRDYLVSNSSSWQNFLAKAFSSSRLFGLPRQMMDLIAKTYPPLGATINSMRRHFPGYLSDFISLETCLMEFPEVDFIGHGPLFWKGIAADWACHPSDYPRSAIREEGITCKLLSNYDNMYADLSGTSGFNALYRDSRFARRFLTRYDHKLLYGSDNFELPLQDLLRTLDLPKRTCDRIYHENATKLISKQTEA